MTISARVLLGRALLACFGHTIAAGDFEHGQSLYQSRCAVCHSLEYNGVGPSHQGIFGRKAGSALGYRYSQALGSANITWDDVTLNLWLTDPEKFIPGQKMSFSVPDASERADLIAYLKKVSTSGNISSR